ncbi:NAD-dependent epimerase/dehydratase family protein [Ottowia testudinis]|uniref:NAD-dependent epimerase/dehydratase family protein n=1 Tax=Ottowia testudinis TaxID=2816950 RepID=A0A975H4U6_9BURK|nr:NAD-dependent epimerase/dehydratase family protein [Ottowia testudinis]QTD44282.1 NAD-dependent epimerase/dehydratase family protein [Ottowia testudinis]
MPSNQSPLGALPARFRRPRVLIVGFGDVGARAARLLTPRVRVLALTREAARAGTLRARGVTPLAGDLDDAPSLRRLAGLAARVVHLAPPPGEGEGDPRTAALLHALSRRAPPMALVYASTSGVYGDRGGAWTDETHAPRPQTARARRRVAAESAVRAFGRAVGMRTSILRIPGIYAEGREGGTPRARLERGTPVLTADDDVYTNHIHADDLARAVVAALWRGKPQRVVNACDDSQLKMGDYFDLAADLYGLPRPPRIGRGQAREQLTPTLLSFMSESRRLRNTRLKRELRLRLCHPTPATGLLTKT